MDCKYISFEELDNRKRKTKLWNVVAEGDDILGFIEYDTGWRRYAFFPYGCTRYEHDCLRKIADFLEKETSKLKATWKKK